MVILHAAGYHEHIVKVYLDKCVEAILLLCMLLNVSFSCCLFSSLSLSLSLSFYQESFSHVVHCGCVSLDTDHDTAQR